MLIDDREIERPLASAKHCDVGFIREVGERLIGDIIKEMGAGEQVIARRIMDAVRGGKRDELV